MRSPPAALLLLLLAAAVSLLALGSGVAEADKCVVTIIRRLDGCTNASCQDDCHEKLREDEQCQETGCSYERHCEGRHCRCEICYTGLPPAAAGGAAPKLRRASQLTH